MRKRYCIIVLLLVCICKYSTAQILCIYCYDQNDSISSGINNLLLNGSFENTNCIPNDYTSGFCPSSSYYSCTIVNWICTGGGSLTYVHMVDSTFSIIAEGAVAPYFGNWYSNACTTATHDTSCMSTTGCTVTGIPAGYPINPNVNYGWAAGVSLEQTVTGLSPGNTYVLEFWAGGEIDMGQFTNSGLFAVDIGFGKTMLRDKPSPPSAGIGTRYIIEFNAVLSSHTIKFTNWGHIDSTCTELVLDDVRLYTLAELSPIVPHCTIGTNEFNNNNTTVNLFPNPITYKLNITYSNNELSEIILYDVASRKLLQQKFTNSVSLNTEQLAKGIYLYEVRNKNGVVKKGKVVKD